MSGDMKFGLSIVLFVLVLFGGLGLLALTENDTVWEQTEDSDCYLRIHDDRRLLGDDTTTRTRYCKEVSS